MWGLVLNRQAYTTYVVGDGGNGGVMFTHEPEAVTYPLPGDNLPTAMAAADELADVLGLTPMQGRGAWRGSDYRPGLVEDYTLHIALVGR